MIALIKKIAAYSALVLAMAFAGTAVAAGVNDGDIKTLKVTDATLSNNDWGTAVNVHAGDQVSFQLHYYLEEGVSTPNMKFFLENLHGRTFNAGASETVSGQITATGLSSDSDTALMNFADSVRFDLYNVSWQVYPCTSVGCEESLPDDYRNVVKSTGFSIGEVDGTDAHYTGNVIVTFKTTKVGSTPTEDVDVRTNNATNIDDDSARINGTVTDGDNVNVWFAFDDQSSVSCTDSSDRINIAGSFDQGDDFSLNVTNLDEDTNYFFRACADEDGTVVSGDRLSFKTDSDYVAPDVQVRTDSATNVDEDSAQLNGAVTEGDNVNVWFAFDDQTSVSCTDSSDRLSVSGNYDKGDDFEVDVTNLDDDTYYYFRACADEDGAVVSGNRLSFRTDDNGYNPPSNNDDIEIATEDADDVDEDSAELVGSVEEGDDISVWFVMDDSSDVRCSDRGNRYTVTGSYDDGDEFTRTVSGLEENERYYFRACGEDEDGNEDEGSLESFRTDDEGNNGGDGDISTLSATDIDDDSAELRGRVEEGDDLRVWFSFSRTDSTPSCNSSSQRLSVSGRFDEDDIFDREVSGLREGTTYYFRACSEDEEGEILEGSIRSFQTDGDNGPSDIDPLAITDLPSSITTNSARFNGTAIGDDDATCYFEYGRTAALGLTTGSANIDLDRSSQCSSLRTGLTSGTAYYYRLVVRQDGETFRGQIRSFRTNSVVIVTPGTPNNPTPSEPEELDIIKWVSAETDPEFDIYTEAARGEAVFYRVRVENNTNETIEDVTVVDQIPYYLELDAPRSLDDDSEKEVTWFINSLRPNQSRTFITEMRVREDASTGDEIYSYATISYDDTTINSNDVIIEVEGAFDDIYDEDNQTASIFGAGFLPNTLFGWLALIIAILIIAFLLSRILFTRAENQRILEELKDMKRS